MQNRQGFFFHNNRMLRSKTMMKFLHDGELYLFDEAIEDAASEFHFSKHLLPLIRELCSPHIVISSLIDQIPPDGDRHAILVPKESARLVFYMVLKTLGDRSSNFVGELLQDAFSALHLKKEDLITPIVTQLPPLIAPPIPVESIVPAFDDPDLRYFASPSQKSFAELDEILAQGGYPLSPGSRQVLKTESEAEDEKSHESKKPRR